MRKALLVGIDDYPRSPLKGCVKDAQKIQGVLAHNYDGSPNFSCKALLSNTGPVNRADLRKAIGELFSSECDVALLYFAGHGLSNTLDSYLVTSDVERDDEGVAMTEVLAHINKSPAREVVVVLDSCHSGAFGSVPSVDTSKAFLRNGASVLAACRDVEKAVEYDTGGIFTAHICDALDGGAADVCGKVTVASVYAYVDETLGAWQQRPVFKSHVSKLIHLRKAAPAVPIETIRRLPEYFPTAEHDLRLDPSYEPDADPRGHSNEKVFLQLQKLRAARLVVPVGEEHMYYAAMNSKSCQLTPLGRFYWHLAKSDKL